MIIRIRGRLAIERIFPKKDFLKRSASIEIFIAGWCCAGFPRRTTHRARLQRVVGGQGSNGDHSGGRTRGVPQTGLQAAPTDQLNLDSYVSVCFPPLQSSVIDVFIEWFLLKLIIILIVYFVSALAWKVMQRSSPLTSS